MDGMSESGIGGESGVANAATGISDMTGVDDAASIRKSRSTDSAIALAHGSTKTAGEATNHSLGRPVLSFVRRSGRLDDRLQRAWDVYHDRYLLDINQAPGSLSMRSGLSVNAGFVRAHWGNAHPLIVEIGTGQGENVVAAAQTSPALNFLAIEVYDPGLAHTMLLAGKRDVSNLRIAQVNAPELFEAMADGLVSEVWTFFPDPWPKMRHHKRRIVQAGLAAQIHRTLRSKGVWRIATDIEDYALHVHEVMDGRADFENVGGLTVSLPVEHVGKGNADEAVSLMHADFAESLRFDGRILTNFEKKGIKAGRAIHDFTYRAI